MLDRPHASASSGRRRQRHRLLPFVLIAASLGAAPAVAFANESASARRNFEVSAGTLEDALNAFARQAGITLLFDASLVKGKRAAALSGARTIEQGLAELLAGHPYASERTPSGAYAIRRLPGNDMATLLPTVRVAGQNEDAWGPVDGYGAHRSASATKMDVPIIETPQQISVIGATQLRDQAARSVIEAVRYSAGVRPLDHGTTDDDVSVRGFYLTGTGLYRDGMRMINNGFMSNIEPYGMERLEVLHGPSAAMYGQSAPGGLINAVTKRPRIGMAQEAGVEFGSHDRKQITGDFGGALNDTGSLIGRLTVLKRDAGTQWRGLQDDRTYVAPALSMVGDRTRITFLGQLQESRSGFIIPYYRDTPFGPAKRDINVNGPGSFHEKRSHSLGYLFEHTFNDGTIVRNNVRYLDGSNDRREMRNRGLLADQRSMARLAMVRPDSEKTWVMDTQFERSFATGAIRHQGVIGIDVYRSELDWRIQSLTGRVAPLDIIDPVYIEPNWNDSYLTDRIVTRNRQTGIYVQDQMRFGERWVANVALRHDRANAGTRYDARASATEAFSTTHLDRRDRATTGRAGLVYLAPNGLAPYVSYSTAFQPPVTTTTQGDADGKPYQPETARQVEAGLRYAPVHGDYMVSAAVFDLRKRNVRTPSALNPRFDVQTGEVRTRGLELQAEGKIGRGFSVIAAYTLMDADVTRSNRAYEIGTRPAAVPEHSLALWGKYTRNGVDLGLGVRHISAAPGDLHQAAGPTPQNDGYTLLDLLAAYRLGPWRFSLNITNLTDKRYRTQCNVMRGGADFCALGFGRDVRVGATYRF